MTIDIQAIESYIKVALNHDDITVSDDSARHHSHQQYQQQKAYLIIRIKTLKHEMGRLDFHRKIMKLAQSACPIPIHAINIYTD